ncbi:hypothetical protein GCM10023144_42500 [Pigmentiphaga soli]|uniref:Gluconate 2-dehydrogenase subunit 3 family protein n=1 Tax=Pigmentiphaga soli TaxID=1007095 RepID=A0ABP8HN09_9BURK
MDQNQPNRRRDVLKAFALGVPAALSARTASAAAPSSSPPPGAAAAQPGGGMPMPMQNAGAGQRTLRFFNREEAEAMDAIAARLIPADELGPGAKEAGVTRFIDDQLAGAWGSGDQFYRQGPFEQGTPEQGYQLSYTPAEMFRAGLAKLADASNKAHGRRFAELSAADQDALLGQLEKGQLDFSPLPAAVFFQALLDATMEGFFSDPLYGGNGGMAGWKLVGFPGAYASFSNDIERHGVAWTRPPVSIADSHGHEEGHRP